MRRLIPMFRWIGVWIAVCLSVTLAAAHESRPAFLSVTEIDGEVFQAVFKQGEGLDATGQRPKQALADVAISVIFPSDCEVSQSSRQSLSGNMTETFKVFCALKTGEIQFAGMDSRLTDVFVELRYLNGDILSTLIKSGDPVLTLGTQKAAPLRDYVKIGIEHILFGWDHLLFVICLTLMVERRQILGVATSFTLAHSLTLGLAVFDIIALPIRPIEILIAASIVLMAGEVLRKMRGESSLALRKPYLLGFLIGLIHGCGFASALSSIGLPSGLEIWALFLFNFGVEVGQFLIVFGLMIVLGLLKKINSKTVRPTQIVLTYSSAALAMFWVLERSADYLV